MTTKRANNGNFGKSTTHEERYFHIRDKDGCLEGTVFMRQEDNGKWYGSVAIRDKRDQPVHRIGRQVARRKYFNGKRCPCVTPSYDEAEALFDDIYNFHLSQRGK